MRAPHVHLQMPLCHEHDGAYWDGSLAGRGRAAPWYSAMLAALMSSVVWQPSMARCSRSRHAHASRATSPRAATPSCAARHML